MANLRTANSLGVPVLIHLYSLRFEKNVRILVSAIRHPKIRHYLLDLVIY